MCRRLVPCLAALVLALSLPLQAADPKEAAEQLRTLDEVQVVVDPDKAKALGQMLSSDIRERMRAANQRETKHWQAIKTKADWEAYRDARIKALRDTLGDRVSTGAAVREHHSHGESWHAPAAPQELTLPAGARTVWTQRPL